MPFNKYDEIKTPKCEFLEELWPAILTKAILKLFKYKFSNKNYDEIGDLHIIYALTGYQSERILLKNPNSVGSYILNTNNCSNKNKIDLKSNLILNKFFDSDDALYNKFTQEKLKVVIKNILSDENYLKKKKFILNFNTLNQSYFYSNSCLY